MGYKQVGGAFAASVFAISAVIAPAFQSETMVEAATKVKLNKTECSLTVGESAKLKLKGGKAVKFESSNTKIATVNKSGKVKAKKAGTVTISVYDEKNKVYKCKVTVTKKTKTGTKDYGNIDLGGMEIIIRDWWSPSLDSDYVQEPSNDYEVARNKYQKEMMEKYNFTIREASISDWGAASTDFVDYVTNGGDDVNYIFTLHTDEITSNAMASGLMYDLSTLDCLDFSSEKFARNKLHEQYSVGSSIYAFFPGYSEPRTGVFFNKQVLRNAGIDPDSIYEAQKNGTWTWDKFEEIMEKCQRDLDGDGVNDIYGMTLNESVMTDMAVLSNGGAYIGKNKKGQYTYELESPETLEALQWCVDMYSKFDDHDPDNVNWDYYQDEWSEGKVAFLIEQEYIGVRGNLFEFTDFDMGFVMFPKGPKAKDYVSLFSNNVYTIPACYDADRAWKIAFAWNVYTNPAPGYEDFSGYLLNAENGNFDTRALEETIPMMSESKRGVVTYDLMVGISTGPELTWSIAPNADVASIIDGCRDSWKKAIKEANIRMK